MGLRYNLGLLSHLLGLLMLCLLLLNLFFAETPELIIDYRLPQRAPRDVLVPEESFDQALRPVGELMTQVTVWQLIERPQRLLDCVTVAVGFVNSEFALLALQVKYEVSQREQSESKLTLLLKFVDDPERED